MLNAKELLRKIFRRQTISRVSYLLPLSLSLSPAHSLSHFLPFIQLVLCSHAYTNYVFRATFNQYNMHNGQMCIYYIKSSFYCLMFILLFYCMHRNFETDPNALNQAMMHLFIVVVDVDFRASFSLHSLVLGSFCNQN